MNDYERVARVIRYLDEHHTEQPGLAELAAHLGLSPFHFHRLFTDWAGITPKDFLQSLTLMHVKQWLRAGESVLDTALAAGFSGPGRLHDLCVTLEAASPGEVKTGGKGWRMVFGFAPSPFGECLLAESPRGICYLGFVDDSGPARQAAQAALAAAWPAADHTRDDAAAGQLAGRVFARGNPGAARPKLRTFVRGSAFQVKVWNALLAIPTGSLVSYGGLAKAVGHPGAARAVGTAVGINPIAYLIPCHRVIRETGVIGHYAYGHERKCAMVAWETAGALAAEGTLGLS